MNLANSFAAISELNTAIRAASLPASGTLHSTIYSSRTALAGDAENLTRLYLLLLCGSRRSVLSGSRPALRRERATPKGGVAIVGLSLPS